MSTELHFDEATHTYTKDGVVIPSVTQVMESVGIIDYSMIPWETREVALKRGSDVHLLTQFEDEGDLLEASVEPHLRGYLAAWRRFKVEHEIGRLPITLMEHRGCHDFGYAGTLDRLFGTRVLLDIKTGAAPWWVRIQLAAYREMLKRGPLIRIALELHKDGTYRPRECPMLEHRYDFDTFVAALRIAREKEGKAW